MKQVKYQIKTEKGALVGTVPNSELQVMPYDLEDVTKRTSFLLTNINEPCGQKELGFVSIQSATFPNMFWKHNGAGLYLHDRTDNNEWGSNGNKDSCWKVEINTDCSSNSAVSIQSMILPSNTITNCNGTLKIKSNSDNCGNKANKCWLLSPHYKGNLYSFTFMSQIKNLRPLPLPQIQPV